MAAPFVVAGLLEVGMQLIDRIFPNKEAQAEAKLKLLELQQSGELRQLEADVQLALGQMAVNKEEAKAGPWRGGWRPGIGWVCAAALAYEFVIRPLLAFAMILAENPVPIDALPTLDMSTLLPLMFGMLGLGTLRTYEKTQGLA